MTPLASLKSGEGAHRRQHDERAVDAVERPLDRCRVVPVAVHQFHALVHPVRRFLATADQRAYPFAVGQQMPGRCAADFSRNSHN